MGANRRQILLEITLPATVPAILAGIRTALSSGWMCVVAAEMIVAKQGVGFRSYVDRNLVIQRSSLYVCW
ncbi:MAG: ABC transporter permease subunit [Ruminococcus sp.]